MDVTPRRRPVIPIKGRGTPERLAHRFERDAREPFDDGWEAEPDDPDAPPPATEVTPEQARSLLAANDSPDIPFDRSINPYRGCEHGCSYCYARPTHSYLNLSPGLDFETRLVAKVNAGELLRAELSRPGYRPSPVNIGSATDAYQPIERRLRLTRAVLEVLTACEHPFTIVTKSTGIERDLDLIAPAARRGQAAVFRAWLDQHLPERAARVMARVRDMRGGKDYDADFAHRMKGQGPWAELIGQRVRRAAARHGLPRERVTLDCSRFRPPARDAAQQTLF